MNWSIFLNYLKYLPFVIQGLKIIKDIIESICDLDRKMDYKENLDEDTKCIKREALIKNLIDSGISESLARICVEAVFNYKKLQYKSIEPYKDMEKGL